MDEQHYEAQTIKSDGGSGRPFYVVCITNTATGRSVFGRASDVFGIAQQTAWETMAELEATVPHPRPAAENGDLDEAAGQTRQLGADLASTQMRVDQLSAEIADAEDPITAHQEEQLARGESSFTGRSGGRTRRS